MKVDGVDHISVAVRDVEGARKAWEPILGKSRPDEAYVDEREQISVVRYWLGGIGFELMESTTPDGPVARWIGERGEGVMILSFSVENTRQAIEELEAKGYPFVRAPGGEKARRFRDGKFAFIHPKKVNSVLLELIDDKWHESKETEGRAGQKALIVIDVQNDYFPGGTLPLWNTDTTLDNIERAVMAAVAKGVPVVHVQHIANPEMGIAPFFNKGTEGARIHPRILAAAPAAPVVIKEFADSFLQTSLEQTLDGLGVGELLVCGMMTQNCVTHTAISRSAEKYKVSILPDCCTTVNEMIHAIALHAVSTRVPLVDSGEAV